MGPRRRATAPRTAASTRTATSRTATSRTVATVLAALGGALGSALLAAPGPAGAAPLGPSSPVCVPRSAPARAARLAPGGAFVNPGGDHRLRQYTLRSTALGTPAAPVAVRVRVLLPAGYASAPRGTRYPVLYLLHGHGGGAADWSTAKDGRVESLVGRLPLIVVMPDGGYDGFYSDWYGTDVDGHNGRVAPGWETFHIDELIPWVDATFPTRPTRSGRAVAGLSMGGFGAMSYAARHPDLFSVAGAFSGATDPDLDYPVSPAAQGLVANLPDGRAPDNCIWGDPVTEDVVWRDHDPTELAPNLADLALFVAYGDGRPDSRPGAPAWSPAAGLTEAGVGQQNNGFVAALRAAGQQPVVDAYGPGTHDWFYWRRDLARFLGLLPRSFWAGAASADRAPARFSYRSADPAFSVWGWRFGTGRSSVSEFTYLDGVGAGGFTVRGSGSLTVTTPPLPYRPGTRLVVTVTPEGALPAGRTPGTRTVVTVGRDRRATFTVRLGTARPVRQYLFGPSGERATFPVAYAVGIGRAARA